MYEGVANVSFQTYAIRGVTYNMTLGVRPACIDARICTFLVDASKLIRAFAIADAFWPTVWRGANEFRKARA